MGKNDVIVRYFSQNHGVSVTNDPPFHDVCTVHNTLVLYFFIILFYEGMTVR